MEKNRTIKITNVSNALICFLILFSLHGILALAYVVSNWMITFWAIHLVCAVILIFACIFDMSKSITIDLENKVITRKTLFKSKTISLEQISAEQRSVLLVKGIVLKDGNGKWFFDISEKRLKEQHILPENFVEFFHSQQYDDHLLDNDAYLSQENNVKSKIALIIVSIFSIGVFLAIFIAELTAPPTYPIVDIKFYRFGVLWVLLAYIMLLIVGLVIRDKRNIFSQIVAVIMAIAFIPSFLFAAMATPEDYSVSSTQDFANYQQVFDEEMGGDYQHFPQQVDGEIVKFSYYYKNYWDSVHELYLEVNYDKQTFEEIYNTYQDKHACYFDNSLEEVDLCEAHLETTKSNGTLKISSAWIEKIIFDKQNNTIIYYYLSSSDFLELEWCQLAKRFDIDFEQYEQYLEQLNEKSKV